MIKNVENKIHLQTDIEKMRDCCLVLTRRMVARNDAELDPRRRRGCWNRGGEGRGGGRGRRAAKKGEKRPSYSLELCSYNDTNISVYICFRPLSLCSFHEKKIYKAARIK